MGWGLGNLRFKEVFCDFIAEFVGFLGIVKKYKEDVGRYRVGVVGEEKVYKTV